MGRVVMARVVAVSLMAAGCQATSGGDGRPPVAAPTPSGSPSVFVSSPRPPMTPRQYTATGKFTVDRVAVTRSDSSYAADGVNQSAILVSNSGKLTMSNPQIDKSGDSPSNSESGFFGVNAAVLAQSAGAVVIKGGSVTTDGQGASGLFAYGETSSVSMTGGTIETSGDNSHGAVAADRAKATLARVKVTTSGAHSAAVTAARGGGVVTVIGGELSTSGRLSPGAYSMGTVTCTGARLVATQGEGVVVDGASSISMKDCLVRGAIGARLYRLGGRHQGPGLLTVDGGRLVADNGATFLVTGTTATITVKRGARVQNTGRLLDATRLGRATLVVEGTGLTGDVVTDKTSVASVELRARARLTGRISRAALALGRSSGWNVTDDSTLTELTGAAVKGGAVENITGNGNDVHYDPRLPANGPLAGRTYSLTKGGRLLPRR
ncbi:hypothetical protein [Microtetraspora sp. NBRC 16547]|uniref:hypothetical protein n=1 Tax=Microtetraspora sp. NBRC 16547 TaxID=3030993 RepID=UPI0024A1D79D|nr:hypothetical protein [Microtetraspora sp. NBRC 16547]GLW99985.1 hypothetical protein Misp02_40720 [Microtetraspora sp. NBRC 16547]